MAKEFTFGNTIVEVASSGESPNWASGIVEAFEAIEETLALFTGPFDVPQQSVNIDAFNPGVANTNITALNFPPSNVRAARIDYAIYRQTTTTTAYEAGQITIVYNASNPVTEKWELQRDAVGEAFIEFMISDTGQFSFTSTAIAGATHTGNIIFSASAILIS